MSMNKHRAVAAVMAASALALAGCGEAQQIRDLEDVTVTEPDKVRLVVSVDQFPNVVAMCIEGVGFVATTRDDRPLQESPGLTERWCAQ